MPTWMSSSIPLVLLISDKPPLPAPCICIYLDLRPYGRDAWHWLSSHPLVMAALWLAAAPLFPLYPFGAGWPLWPVGTVRTRCPIPLSQLGPSAEPPHCLWLGCWAKRHQCPPPCVFKGQWFSSQGPFLALTGACTCTSCCSQQ